MCPTVVLLALLVCGIRCAQQIRQERLDQALIQAIKKQDATTAISLLKQGANANTTNRPYKLLTWRSLWMDFWSGLKGIKPPPDTTHYSPALALVFGPVGLGLPDTSVVMMLNPDDFAPMDFPWKDTKASVPLISAMLEHGARLDTKDHLGDTLLEYACIRGDAPTVRFLFAHHVDSNAKAFDGFPLLMCTRDYDCTRLLLEAGSDANARDSDGRTPLMCIDNTKQYSLLFIHGADLNAQDSDGQTALIHLFVSVYRNDQDIHTGMRLLVQHGARVSLKDKTGKTALDYAKAGRANWMSGNAVIGGRDMESIHFLEEALKRERTQQVKPL
jgi:hypothetical protein